MQKHFPAESMALFFAKAQAKANVEVHFQHGSTKTVHCIFANGSSSKI